MIRYKKFKYKILSSKLLKDSFWSLFGNVIFRGLSLISGIVIARFLGKDIFGEFGILKNTLISIALFSTFGLGYTATKFVAEYKNKHPEQLKFIVFHITRITLIISSIMAILLILFANYISKSILEAVHLNTSLRILAIVIVFNALTTLQIGILSGLGKFKEMARINLVLGVFTFLLTITLTWFYNLNGALFALLLIQILNWYLNYRLVKSNMPNSILNIENDKIILKQILVFSTPVAFQEALFSITFWISNFLLIKYASYGELGLYTASMQWNAVILFIPGIMGNVMLSHFSEVENNYEKHARILKKTLLINFFSTLIPVLIIFGIANYISNYYGVTFENLSQLIRITVFITIFQSISSVYSQAYLSKGLNWEMFIFRFIRDIGIIGVFLILFRNIKLGAISMVYSQLILNCIFMIIIILFYKKVTKEK